MFNKVLLLKQPVNNSVQLIDFNGMSTHFINLMPGV